MSLIAELKRRNVLRVAAAYVVTAWLVIQVAETVFPLFGFGDEPARITVLVLVALFVPALVMAWVFEWTPQGLKREDDVDRSVPADPRIGRRFDRVIMIVLAAAVGYFAVDKFVLSAPPETARTADSSAPARERPARAEPARPVLAVLPFLATSLDGDSDFFATGVHEDLLTQLAQLETLRVISRTSVAEYRDTEKNLRQIGQELGASAILEGRIQSAGGRIRINMQLIDAASDQHLWAGTFDRELSTANIFDVQAEVARAVAQALKATLTEEDEADLRVLPTQNMAAYRAYHEALELRDNDWRAQEAYRALLREAAALDPGFTRPLAELVGSLGLEGFRNPSPDLLSEVEAAIDRIRAVAPGSADHLIAQAYYTYYLLQDYDLALELVRQALALKPSDPRLMEVKAWIERRLGDHPAMIDSLRATRELDPRNPRWTFMLVHNLALAHRYDEASRVLEEGNLATDPDVAINTATYQAYLALRNHRDFSRLRSDIEALYEEFPQPPLVEELFFVRVADRDFEAALEAAILPGRSAGPFGYGLEPQTESELLARWLLGGGEAFDTLLAQARASFEATQEEAGTNSRLLLGEALLGALEGDGDGAERLVRRWYREGGTDWPDRVAFRDTTCMILGLAGAGDAAVDCLRTGLEEPSLVAPFLDPYLPWYDGIRDDPAFLAMVAEVEGEWSRNADAGPDL